MQFSVHWYPLPTTSTGRAKQWAGHGQYVGVRQHVSWQCVLFHRHVPSAAHDESVARWAHRATHALRGASYQQSSRALHVASNSCELVTACRSRRHDLRHCPPTNTHPPSNASHSLSERRSQSFKHWYGKGSTNTHPVRLRQRPAGASEYSDGRTASQFAAHTVPFAVVSTAQKPSDTGQSEAWYAAHGVRHVATAAPESAPGPTYAHAAVLRQLSLLV